MAINTQKVVVGGLGAGVVLAVLDFLVNGVLMADANEAAINALNPALAEGMEGTSMMVAFIAIDLLFGILLVWTYAAMRARFGPGPKTAVIAGLQVWLVTLLMYLGMTSMGMWGWDYFFMGAAAYVVILTVASIAGAMIYKEE